MEFAAAFVLHVPQEEVAHRGPRRTRQHGTDGAEQGAGGATHEAHGPDKPSGPVPLPVEMQGEASDHGQGGKCHTSVAVEEGSARGRQAAQPADQEPCSQDPGGRSQQSPPPAAVVAVRGIGVVQVLVQAVISRPVNRGRCHLSQRQMTKFSSAGEERSVNSGRQRFDLA